MIISTISQSYRYVGLHPLFNQLFDYINKTELSRLKPGRYDIAKEKLFAIVEHVPAREKEAAKLEVHQRYIDLQLVLQGDETMGWKPLADCQNPMAEYSKERDIRFFHDLPASYLFVPPGHFCIFFPEDAHAPLVGRGEIRKVIFKIEIDGK